MRWYLILLYDAWFVYNKMIKYTVRSKYTIKNDMLLYLSVVKRVKMSKLQTL